MCTMSGTIPSHPTDVHRCSEVPEFFNTQEAPHAAHAKISQGRVTAVVTAVVTVEPREYEKSGTNGLEYDV